MTDPIPRPSKESGYAPDTRQRLARATRFFARIERAILECPRCGKVYQVSSRSPSPNWDPMTARFTCTNKSTGGTCGRTYVLGLVAWPIIPTPKVASATPRDQVPNERQLVQLRQEGGGWWLAKEAGQRSIRPEETNLTLEDDRPTFEEDDDDD
jgi:hypothetical protein